MKLAAALSHLGAWDQRGKYLYTVSNLELVFNETGRTLRSTLSRLMEAGVLERVARGLYLYAHSRCISSVTIEDVACALRPGELCFEGLESAASRWGVVSQVPVGRLTVVTTGREGEVVTPWGVIEYTHTKASLAQIVDGTVARPGHPLRLATKAYAVRGMLNCRRNVHLIDWEEVDDEAEPC